MINVLELNKKEFEQYYINRFEAEWKINLYNEYTPIINSKHFDKKQTETIVEHFLQWLEYEGSSFNFFTDTEICYILNLYNKKTSSDSAYNRKRVKFIIHKFLIYFVKSKKR